MTAHEIGNALVDNRESIRHYERKVEMAEQKVSGFASLIQYVSTESLDRECVNLRRSLGAFRQKLDRALDERSKLERKLITVQEKEGKEAQDKLAEQKEEAVREIIALLREIDRDHHAIGEVLNLGLRRGDCTRLLYSHGTEIHGLWLSILSNAEKVIRIENRNIEPHRLLMEAPWSLVISEIEGRDIDEEIKAYREPVEEPQDETPETDDDKEELKSTTEIILGPGGNSPRKNLGDDIEIQKFGDDVELKEANAADVQTDGVLKHLSRYQQTRT